MSKHKKRLTAPASDSNTIAQFCHGLTNKDWLNVKVLNFLLFGALGAVIPYICLYFRKRGLSAAEIGIIESLFIFIAIFSRPIFGTIANKTSRHKLVLGACILVFTVLSYALTFVRPSLPPAIRYPVTLSCDATNNQFLFESCGKDSYSVLDKMSTIQPKFFLHHADLGFRENCSSVERSCQAICRNFMPIKHEEGVGTVIEPFSGLGLQVGSSRNGTREGCLNFPLNVAPSHRHVTLACNNSLGMPCEVDCGCSKNKTEIDPQNYNVVATEHEKAEGWRLFLTILMLRSIGAIPFGPSISLVDSITYDILGPRRQILWGQQRLFGAASWGLVAGILGLLLDATGNYDIIFYTLGVCGLGAGLVSLFWLPSRLRHHSDEDAIISLGGNRQKPLPFLTALRSVFAVPLYCISCLVALASGMLLSVIYIVWPLFLIEDLGTKKWMVGAAASIYCIIEIPCLFFAGHVVSRLGESVCFMLMFAAYGLRFLSYAYLTPATAWLVLPLQTLHVFCFTFYYAAASRFAATVALPGTSAAAQTILQACFFGLGLGLGNMASSAIYQVFGGHLAFLIYSGFAFGFLLLLFVVYLSYMRKAVAQTLSDKVERIGSFSPTLNPDASFVDDDDDATDEQAKSKQSLPENPYITSSPTVFDQL